MSFNNQEKKDERRDQMKAQFVLVYFWGAVDTLLYIIIMPRRGLLQDSFYAQFCFVLIATLVARRFNVPLLLVHKLRPRLLSLE